jgi:hypothetical protein
MLQVCSNAAAAQPGRRSNRHRGITPRLEAAPTSQGGPFTARTNTTTIRLGYRMVREPLSFSYGARAEAMVERAADV